MYQMEKYTLVRLFLNQRSDKDFLKFNIRFCIIIQIYFFQFIPFSQVQPSGPDL